MTFSEHSELAIELETQSDRKLELKLFPATFDLYASSKGAVISTLNGEIRSLQNDKVFETKEITLNPQLIFEPQGKFPGTALSFEPASNNSEFENLIADESRQIIAATKTLLEPFRSEIEAQVCELKLQQCLERVGKNGEEISLTGREFLLLSYLMENTDKIISKERLYEQVWGAYSAICDNTIMVHIRHLREKIEDSPSSPRQLVTVKGLGYKLKKRTG